MERRQLLERWLLALQTNQEVDDSQFFVRMFEHEFGDDPPWRRPQKPKDVALLLTSDRIGADEPVLGAAMMGDFLLALAERPTHPKFLVAMTRAALLTVRDSPVLESLQKLETVGVKILVSKASLKHFAKTEEQRVGEAVSMLQIVDTLYDVEKVLTL